MNLKKVFISLAIVTWVGVTLFVTTKMHGWHWVSFKTIFPKSTQELNVIESNWGMIHVLGQGCSCSEFVAEHLIRRGKIKGHSESVIVIGDYEYADELKKSGFKVSKMRQRKDFITGVPMLLVHNEKNEVKYSGGYSNKVINPTTQIEDIEIFNNIKNEVKIASYGIMGCAVSKKLQKILDPFNLKYQKVKKDVKVSKKL